MPKLIPRNRNRYMIKEVDFDTLSAITHYLPPRTYTNAKLTNEQFDSLGWHMRESEKRYYTTPFLPPGRPFTRPRYQAPFQIVRDSQGTMQIIDTTTQNEYVNPTPFMQMHLEFAIPKPIRYVYGSVLHTFEDTFLNDHHIPGLYGQYMGHPLSHPFMVDVEFLPEKQNWGHYMTYLRHALPTCACVTDVSDDLDRFERELQDIRALRIPYIVIPIKAHGLVKQLPNDPDIVIGLSVIANSTKYGGFPFEDWSDLVNRNVHLLGGAPRIQTEWAEKVFEHGGTVITVDGNSIQRASLYGKQLTEDLRFESTEKFSQDNWRHSVLVLSRHFSSLGIKCQEARQNRNLPPSRHE